MRRFVVGTAGHVDHGKTTLVHALTGVDTDRLPEEKRRGITIELGFASWDLGQGVHAGVVDVPGHRRLVHTMIAGAVGMELVIWVVAADEGVMPQTREHIAACEILGIRRAVIAITKTDRVERELAELAGAEVSELIGARMHHEIVYVSAKTRDGLDELTEVVRRTLMSLPPRAPSTYAELAVDRVFGVKGAGTVVTGTLVRGALGAMMPLRVVSPDGVQPTTVRGLHVHDRAVDRAEAPTRLAVNLANVGLTEVNRGALLTNDPSVVATKRFDAELVLLRDIKPGALLDVYVGTGRTQGKLQILQAATEDAPALGRVRLSRPLPVTGAARFVLRVSSSRGPTGAVAGGGLVLDASPPPLRRRGARLAFLRAARLGEVADAARALVTERAPRSLTRSELGGRFALEVDALVGRLEKAADKGEVVRLKDDGYVDRGALQGLAEQARALVLAHHAEFPLERGLKLETLRQKLAQRTSPAVASEAIRLAAKRSPTGEPIVVEGDIARAIDFAAGALPEVKGPTGEVVAGLAEAALKGLGEFALLERTRRPPKELRTILSRLQKDGLVVFAGDQWFDARAIAELRDRVVEHLLTTDILTIAAFKDLSGLGRKQAIPLLELFDREGVTVRRGDDRAPGPKGRR